MADPTRTHALFDHERVASGYASAAVRHAAERTPIPRFYQVHRGDRIYASGRVTVLPFVEFCRQLEMP